MVLQTVFDGAYPLSEGLAAVKLGGKWGWVDRNQAMAIPAVYRTVEPFSGGLAQVGGDDGGLGYIDTKGTQYWED